ncbi:MAG: BamA/TamA family outer membrane protein [Ignavibacteriaceae bacterium]
MLKFYLILSVLFIVSSRIFPAQIIFGINSDSTIYKGKYFVKIDSFEIKGNKITEDDIILRELTFSKGDTVSNNNIEYDRERIFSLGIFTKVQLYVKRVDEKNILVIDVEESWYIYPIPFVELQDRDWKKFSYGIDVVIQNFRGRNELLQARGSLGYDPSIRLSYYKPEIIKGSDIFFNSILSYSNVKNKSVIAEYKYGGQFDQKIFTGLITIGKRFGNFHRFGVDLGYEYVASPVFLKGISASNERIDRMPVVGATYSYDSRDLAQFPKNGIYALADIQFKGLGLNNIKYQVATIDFREYRPVFDDLYFKWRFASRIAFGNLVPYYDFSFLGYQERIRGHFNDIQEGNYYYLGSAEFYYPLIKDINIALDFIPLLPKSLLTYRIALYSELFGDAGVAKLRHQKLNINDFQSGYGLGLTFLILPYNLVRFEFALNEYNKGEFIFDLGLSF